MVFPFKLESAYHKESPALEEAGLPVRIGMGGIKPTGQG
jgi:hypothetical protein